MARTKDENGKTMALAAHASFKTKGQGKMQDKNVTCTHYKRSGHDAADCFHLVGY